MAWRVGIDIGGTFTDLVARDSRSGETRLCKVASTPENPARGAAEALARVGEDIPAGEVAFLAHGTTVGTNALIEGKGARTGLIATRGFRDLLEIGRQQRPALYDLSARRPRALVARRLRREVGERLDYTGAVIRPLEIAEARRELAALREAGIEALAIGLLHAYANGEHEEAIKKLAEAMLPGVFVSVSSEILPRFREYERISTTVVNAYLGPVMNRYLDDLEARIGAAGLGGEAQIMQSNGGVAPLAEARRKPAATVLSGPAAGVAAGVEICARRGCAGAVVMDMGGTSTDISLIEGGRPATAPGRAVGGYEVELPGVEVRCIGAGGGSLVGLDAAGMLQVGPQSAGAEPGPVCYGRGGARVTLTDAFVLLGRISPEGLLGGEMRVEAEAARAAMAAQIGGALGVGAPEAAFGAVQVAVASIGRAVEAMTLGQGRDPREQVLVAAGGAGPLVAAELAAHLQMREVVVPGWPGAFSAGGLLVSDVRRDWVRTLLVAGEEANLAKVAQGYKELEREAKGWARGALGRATGARLLRAAALRYEGQDYELEVSVPAGSLEGGALGEMRRRFEAEHERRYGYVLRDRAFEVVDIIVSVIGERGDSKVSPVGAKPAGEAGRGRVYVGREEGFVECVRAGRAGLEAGEVVAGPAIIEQYDATCYVPPEFAARVDAGGDLRLARR